MTFISSWFLKLFSVLRYYFHHCKTGQRSERLTLKETRTRTEKTPIDERLANTLVMAAVLQNREEWMISPTGEGKEILETWFTSPLRSDGNVSRNERDFFLDATANWERYYPLLQKRYWNISFCCGQKPKEICFDPPHNRRATRLTINGNLYSISMVFEPARICFTTTKGIACPQCE